MKTRKQNLFRPILGLQFLVLFFFLALSLNADPLSTTFKMENTLSESSTLTLRAKGSKAGGIKIFNLHIGGDFAHFQVYVNNRKVGDRFTTSSYGNYTFRVPFALSAIEEVRIFFDNDAVINGRDRNLFVQSIRLGSTESTVIKNPVYSTSGRFEVPATTENVVYTRTNGDNITYKGVMLYSGFLTFKRQNAGLTINARGTQVNGGYPYFKVYVNDKKIGEGYAYAQFRPYTFHLPIAHKEVKKVRVTFENDAFENGQDRNLYVSKIGIGWNEILANTENVTYKRTDESKITYKGAMYWNGDLIFDEKDAGLVVLVKGTHVNGIFAHFSVHVNDQKVGESFSSFSYQPYKFDLPVELDEVEQVRLTFDNDAFINGQDRNLLVQGIKIGWDETLATTENVTYKRTDGSIITYKGAMYWNGDLIFDNGVEASSSARKGNLNEPPQIIENQSEIKFTIYPNPNNGIFNVDVSGVDDSILNIEVIDQAGRSVFNKQLESLQTQTLEMNLHSLPNGIYFLRVSTDTFTKVQRIIKN